MLNPDARESAAIVDRMLAALLLVIPTRGRSGSDIRTAVGDTVAKSFDLCQRNEIGPKLANCFDLARRCGATMPQLASVRSVVSAESPVTVGGNTLQFASIGICLATETAILAATTFVARDSVDAVKSKYNDVFNEIEEAAADAMDQMSYSVTISLHAAVMAFLTETERPLPRMLVYRFAQPISSLLAAHKLYADGGRADELRDENHAVHPLFMPMTGRALSA